MTFLSDAEVYFLEQMTAYRRLSGRSQAELSAINCQDNPIPGFRSVILTSGQESRAAACFYLRESEDDSVPLICCDNADAQFWGWAGLVSRICRNEFPAQTVCKTVFVEVLQHGAELPRLLGYALSMLLDINVVVLTAVLVGNMWILGPEEREAAAARAFVMGVQCNARLRIRAYGQLGQDVDDAIVLLQEGLQMQ